MYANRVYGAEIVLDDTLQIWRGLPGRAVDNGQRRATAGAGGQLRGAGQLGPQGRTGQPRRPVFTEYWAAIRDARVTTSRTWWTDQDFWLVDFDPEDPLNTPAVSTPAIRPTASW